MKRLSVASTVAVALALLLARNARAQVHSQVWVNLTFDWVKSERLTYELDFEPKALVSAPAGEPGWKNLDVTPNVSFGATKWVDLTGEFVAGYTGQNDDVSSFELTPRIGADFHVLSRVLTNRERQPKRRLALDNYFRVEWRNFFYSDEQPTTSSWRFRNRLGCTFAINKLRHTDDGAYYVLADFEWFLPLSDPAERFSNRQRLRAGFGYRHSFHWRFETLYMWTRSRDTIEDDFEKSEMMIDVRIKRFF